MLNLIIMIELFTLNLLTLDLCLALSAVILLTVIVFFLIKVNRNKM